MLLLKLYVVNLKAKDAGYLTPIIITSSSLCVDAMTDGDVSNHNHNLVLENGFKRISWLENASFIALKDHVVWRYRWLPVARQHFSFCFYPITICIGILYQWLLVHLFSSWIYTIEKSVLSIELCFSASIWAMRPCSEYKYYYLTIHNAPTQQTCPVRPHVANIRYPYDGSCQRRVWKVWPWITVGKRSCKVVRFQHVIALFCMLISINRQP
jgi:hypothetical protein